MHKPIAPEWELMPSTNTRMKYIRIQIPVPWENSQAWPISLLVIPSFSGGDDIGDVSWNQHAAGYEQPYKSGINLALASSPERSPLSVRVALSRMAENHVHPEGIIWNLGEVLEYEHLHTCSQHGSEQVQKPDLSVG